MFHGFTYEHYNLSDYIDSLFQEFPAMQLVLSIGLADGVGNFVISDIRLGDAVVGIPTRKSATAFGTSFDGLGGEGRLVWEQGPPAALAVSALSKLEAMLPYEDSVDGCFSVPSLLHPRTFSRPHRDLDKLFLPTYLHEHARSDCSVCEDSYLIRRSPRETGNIVVHQGSIACTAPPHASEYERCANYLGELGCLCVDQQQTTPFGDFPCLLVRGIASYFDTHPTPQWRNYAAAAAATVARRVLAEIPPGEDPADYGAGYLTQDYLSVFNSSR
ncbi:uncharacterized protein A1O9_07083 [Exophiala aquamarina CBS 119918]|uniref:Nucleoside phosphorylase domain-containing protein n=1 Tax=Exophiala aquamarina CBS 119918 TaxID=1182545 RepID=A0A072PC79_9EURO|nr:uncharacterized protein A1O9_07083 [Exophiala aquamarina CBS 119918]KEF56893.1 hypothetical protein A1O9_07083 [Exophiala aquamarina CBS 119918]